MEIAIFAKRRQNNEGRTFYNYLTKLKRKDGSEVTATVKFRANINAPDPDICPMYITFDKPDASFSSKTVVNEDTGEIITRNTLWLHAWQPGRPWVDESMDEFAD